MEDVFQSSEPDIVLKKKDDPSNLKRLSVESLREEADKSKQIQS